MYLYYWIDKPVDGGVMGGYRFESILNDLNCRRPSECVWIIPGTIDPMDD